MSTQAERFEAIRWRQEWEREVKRNKQYLYAKRAVESAKKHKHKHQPKKAHKPAKISWSHYDPNAHTDYFKPESVDPNNIWDGVSVPW